MYVHHGRGEGEGKKEYIGIVLAAQALGMMGVCVVILQETKIRDPVFALRNVGVIQY